MKALLKRFLLVPLILSQLFFLPGSVLIANAAENGTPGHIIPDCNQGVNSDGQFTNSSGVEDACDFEDLLQLVRNLIRFMALYLTAPALTIAIAYAGALLLFSGGGNEGKRKEAKDVFEKVILGLIAMVAAWFIVEAIYTGLGYGGFLQFS